MREIEIGREGGGSYEVTETRWISGEWIIVARRCAQSVIITPCINFEHLKWRVKNRVWPQARLINGSRPLLTRMSHPWEDSKILSHTLAHQFQFDASLKSIHFRHSNRAWWSQQWPLSYEAIAAVPKLPRYGSSTAIQYLLFSLCCMNNSWTCLVKSKTSPTGDQLCSDTSPYGECSLTLLNEINCC